MLLRSTLKGIWQFEQPPKFPNLVIFTSGINLLGKYFWAVNSSSGISRLAEVDLKKPNLGSMLDFLHLNLFDRDQKEKIEREILSKWSQYLSVPVLATQDRRQTWQRTNKKIPSGFPPNPWRQTDTWVQYCACQCMKVFHGRTRCQRIGVPAKGHGAKEITIKIIAF